MKKVLDKNIKKITISLLVLLLGVSTIYIYMLLSNKPKMKTYTNDVFKFKYDSSWGVYDASISNVLLKHSNNASIKINVKTLDEPYRYETLNTLIDDIVYGIEKQNNNYVMLGQEEVKLTKNKIVGYKFLYEYDDNQVLVAIIKQSDKLITFTYEAEYDYFDILLDSAQNILYNFALVKDKVNYHSKLETIKTNTISYKGTDTVDGTREYEISNYHYSVKYTIPNNFIIHDFNNTYGNYYEKDRNYKSEIQINTAINNLNIYESINKKGSGIEDDIQRLKKNDSNSNIKVEIDKGKLEESYIYRVSYNYNSEYLDKEQKKERLYMLIPLDNSHTFKVTIDSIDKGISEDLINSIKIVSKEKYSQNIVLNYEGNYLVNDMRYMFNTYDKYLNLKLYTPKKYSELDYRANNNEYRYFGYDYDSDKGLYNMNISYYISSLCKTNASKLKDDYKVYEDVKVIAEGNKQYHNHIFDSYTITYRSNNRAKYEKQLIGNIADGICLKLVISSSRNNITDNIVNDLTIFKTEIKNYE